MALNLYAFRDQKSGVLSNHFITSEPFEKVKQNISISLLQLSLKDQTNPFVLFAQDYDLVFVQLVPDSLSSLEGDSVNCSDLLIASRRAFNAGKDQTSPNTDLDKSLE